MTHTPTPDTTLKLTCNF